MVIITKSPNKIWCSLITSLALCVVAAKAKYPNEIIDTPIVNCEQDKIVIKIRTSTANPSHIYAEDFYDTQKCTVRNQNRIIFPHGECGMTTEHMENPAGTMYRICLSVQIHPLFITDSDRSYCAQCVYMEANIVDDLEQKLAISEMTPNELDPQFDEASTPHCTYSIRKGSIEGPEVHAAVVGESVFHVWQCSNENVGILVQNCHVEDLQGDKILIIDQNGCGVDQYLFRTPQYSADLHTAHLQSNVFKFVDKSMTRFRCQLRLCVKNRGHGCESITPPSGCPSIDSSADAEVHLSSTASSYLPEEQKYSQLVTTAFPPYRRIASPPPALPPPAPLSGYENPLPPPSARAAAATFTGNAVAPRFGRPPGALLSGGGPSSSPHTSLTIGPPAIRPVFGPSVNTAHIVSGKTSDSDASTRIPTISTYPSPNSRDGNGGGAPSPTPSPPAINGVEGQQQRASGYSFPQPQPYPYRNVKRRAAVTEFLQKQGMSSVANRLMRKRESGGGQQNFSRPGTIQEKLDVVGLIRVVDNPDDLEYFGTDNHPALQNTRHQVITVAQRTSSSPLPLMPEANPLPLAPTETDLSVGDQEEMTTSSENALPSSPKCVVQSSYWTVFIGFILLFSLQLSVVVLIAMDRLIFNKHITKKVNRIFSKY